jgi:hypothetical protein
MKGDAYKVGNLLRPEMPEAQRSRPLSLPQRAEKDYEWVRLRRPGDRHRRICATTTS